MDFRGNRGWRAGWRFTASIVIYLFAGKGLDSVLVRIHFPDRTFTWSSLLLNYLVDFAFVSAIAWLISEQL